MEKEVLVFSGAYAFSIFILAQILSWVEFKNRIEKLNLTRRLAKAIEEKSSLVRILSHDLATPLTIIMHRTTQLQRMFDSKNDQKLDKAINSIESATNSIISITNKVREIEMQKDFEVHLEREDVNLVDMISSIKENFELPYEEKGVSLKLEIDIPQNFIIQVDETVLKENVISNLVSNALKFSHKDQSVVLGVCREEERVKIFVKDQGEGIPQDIRSNIFEGSVKTSLVGTGGERGTGFGLPIAKLFTEKMGGDIGFESFTKEESQDTGTTFYLKFPI